MEERKKYQNYKNNSLQQALKMVKDEGKTIYKASKETGIPWSTLKRYIQTEQDSIKRKWDDPLH